VKILVINNSPRTGFPSGGYISAEKEFSLLESHGHTLVRVTPSNDEFRRGNMIKKLRTILEIPWSVSAYKQVKKLFEEHEPDIVHIHNVFPMLSPSIYYAVRQKDTPVIQTVHDFMFLCPTFFGVRDDAECRECKDGSFFRSIRYGCFKNSRFQTIPIALMHKLHYTMKTFRKKIDAYICLTPSQRTILLRAGFDAKRMYMKPNFTEDTYSGKGYRAGDYALFIGRLGREKGVKTLLHAWRNLGDITLKIVGDGPEGGELRSLAGELGLTNVEFLGYKEHAECLDVLGGSRFLLVPSIWNEGCPRVIYEAFSHFKPVIASNLGAMADLIEHGKTGFLVEPRNAEALADQARCLWNDPEKCKSMGLNARQEYETNYTPHQNYEMLMTIYETVMDLKRREMA
jgi:glycosyltransferase involved in cell wall biosynthesis